MHWPNINERERDNIKLHLTIGFHLLARLLLLPGGASRLRCDGQTARQTDGAGLGSAPRCTEGTAEHDTCVEQLPASSSLRLPRGERGRDRGEEESLNVTAGLHLVVFLRCVSVTHRLPPQAAYGSSASNAARSPLNVFSLSRCLMC